MQLTIGSQSDDNTKGNHGLQHFMHVPRPAGSRCQLVTKIPLVLVDFCILEEWIIKLNGSVTFLPR